MEVNHLINYVNKDGKIIVNHLVNDYLVKSEDDLATLINLKCAPGTEAYLADESKIWILDNNYEWQVKLSKDSNSLGINYMIVEAEETEIDDLFRLNKTWSEIQNAFAAGVPVWICRRIFADDFDITEMRFVIVVTSQSHIDRFRIIVQGYTNDTYETSSPDGYPTQMISEAVS